MNQATKTTLTIIILAVVAGGYVWYAQRPAPETPPTDGENGQVVDNSDGLLGDEGRIDTSDWITYHHKNHYEYKVPKDWEENPTLDGIYFFNIDDRNQSIKITDPVPTERMLEGYPEAGYRESQYIDSEQPIVISNEPAYQFINKEKDETSVSGVVRYNWNNKEYVLEILISRFINADSFFEEFIKNFTILNRD